MTADSRATPMPTIADAMAKGATTGFDYLRMGLAIAVVLVHSLRITHGPTYLEEAPVYLRALYDLILPLFFALSGFLVAGSLERVKKLSVFLTFRILRIFPALMVEVLLAAILLGPLLTTLPLGAYVGDSDFWQYFLNMLGLVNFDLPGVFETHPVTEVNGSLWTVPYELECYIALSVLALAGLTGRRLLFVGVLVAWCAFIVVDAAVDFRDGYHPYLADFSTFGVYVSQLLVPSFLAGVSLFLYRDRIPFSALFAAAAALAALVCLSSPFLFPLTPFFAAYLCVWLGLQTPPLLPLLRTGDYSYGIYLYAYPIQQMVWQLKPVGSFWLGNFVLSLTLVAVFAAFSWHVVEKPFLRLKTVFFGKSRSQSRMTEAASAAVLAAEAPAAEVPMTEAKG